MTNFAIEIMQSMLFYGKCSHRLHAACMIVEPDDSTTSACIREVFMKATPVVEEVSCSKLGIPMCCVVVEDEMIIVPRVPKRSTASPRHQSRHFGLARVAGQPEKSRGKST